jgi:hopanoid biosynthesis associated protein HpnK
MSVFDRSRRVIINADDFGSSHEVNSAIRRAYCHGLLTSASIMMGGPARSEAIDIARACPGLAVGLHVTLSDGNPTLPPARIPALVGPDGRFWSTQAPLFRGIRWSSAIRRQMRAEVVAQFSEFHATGLKFDHVNSHRNMHLHPLVAHAIFKTARSFGVRFARLPWEPPHIMARAAASLNDVPSAEPRFRDAIRKVRAIGLRLLAYRAGIALPDRTFGMRWSGMMTPERMIALLNIIPPGTNEIYLHPATTDDFIGAVPTYCHRRELEALLDPIVKGATAQLSLGSYATVLA